MTDDERPLVLVSTGTDKRFAFPRLVRWVERWEALHQGGAEVFVQWGISEPSRLPGRSQLSGDELDVLLARASAVVLQGGPGGIMRSRRHGLVPIVVPRLGSLGEAVDDHQVGFARWAGERSMVVVATEETTLHEALDRILADREAYRFEPEEPPTAATVARFAERVDALLRR